LLHTQVYHYYFFLRTIWSSYLVYSMLPVSLKCSFVIVPSVFFKGVQHCVIKFVSELRQIGGFLWVSFTNKANSHDIAEILLKVALSTIKQTKKQIHYLVFNLILIWDGFKLTVLVVLSTDCIGSYNPTTMRSRPRRPLYNFDTFRMQKLSWKPLIDYF
jgi:hypothetical protein